MQDPNTPGVYIQEKNAFPPSIVAVETAVPVFVGYTQKAMRNGESLLHTPTRISSWTEYVELFGGAFIAKFKILEASSSVTEEIFFLNGKKLQAVINDNNSFYFYYSIHSFYQNGGGDCYILSVGTYGNKPAGFEIDLSDFTGNSEKPGVFDILEKETVPALVVLPDVIAKGIAAYPLYGLVLQHCAKMKNRFAIFDVQQSNTQNPMDDIQPFRDGIGTDFLNYGAAYYPWLKTSGAEDPGTDFTNLDESVDLAALLPEPAAKKSIADIKALTPENLEEKKAGIQQALMTGSPSYVIIMQAIKEKLSLLPPAAVMAGIYANVDNTNGVWQAPANVGVAMVSAPGVILSDVQQAEMNVDAVTGKSINAIRLFQDMGTVVWGARTLDGNSQDWRYISVRRTLIWIEQSIKLTLKDYIFEPNDKNTWVAVQAMTNSFLTSLWMQGALIGSKLEDAFNVQIGLGSTMTTEDISIGIMRIMVLVSLVHPAEFIAISIVQQQAS